MRTAGFAAVLLLTAGCGSDVVTGGVPVDDPYEGPMYVPVSEPDHPNVLVRSGASGRALECTGDPYLGSTGRNWGPSSAHYSAVGALEAFVHDPSATLPVRGYHSEREAEDRVLFSFDVDGRTKVAVIVAAAVTDDGDRGGWSMETFASCDPAEFPSSVTDELGIQVWVDAHGERVPITELHSAPGPEHCEWDSATFLDLNGDTFVKDPEGVLPSDWFDAPYESDVGLPRDAEDTGYSLDGQKLWLAKERSAIFIVTGRETERWPAAREFAGCG